MDGGEIMIFLDLEQPQQKQQRTGNPVAADRSVSETCYYSDDATITGDICDKEEGRLLLAGACDSREDGSASMRRSAAEATAKGDGHGTSSSAASAAGCGAADDFSPGEVEEGEGDDGEPSLWSALTFAWVSALPAWLAGCLVSPIVRMGARRALQLADLPPPPRTCRAEWLDAQTARLQGEGRKEEENREAEGGGRRGGRESGQSVVSGGWRDNCPEGAVARAGRMDGAAEVAVVGGSVLAAPVAAAASCSAVSRGVDASSRQSRAAVSNVSINRPPSPSFPSTRSPTLKRVAAAAAAAVWQGNPRPRRVAGLGAVAVVMAVVSQQLSYRSYVVSTNTHTAAISAGEKTGRCLNPCSASALALTVVSQQLCYRSYVVSTNTHTAAISAVHRHLLTLTASALSHVSSGHCINLLSNDVRRLEDLVFFGNALWVAPIELAMVTWLIAREIGWVPTIAGIGTQLLLLPLQLACGKWSVRQREQTAEATDARVKHTEEAFGGILTVKILALERVFTAIIKRLRRTEVSFLQSTAAINAVTDGLYFSFTSVVALVTFATFTCLGGQLTASSVFYVLTLLEIPRYTMGWKVAHGIQNMAEASVSFKRLSHFLQTTLHGARQQGAPSHNGSALLPEERHSAPDTRTTSKPPESTTAALTAPSLDKLFSLQSPPSSELASQPSYSLSSSAPTRLPSIPRAALVLEGASFAWGEEVGEVTCEGKDEMEDQGGEGFSARHEQCKEEESHALQVASAGHQFMGFHAAAGPSPPAAAAAAAASAASSAADAAAASAPVTAQEDQEGQREMGWRGEAPRGRVEGVSVRLGEAELLGVTGKTGSGKSLLLLGILGEVPLSSGAMHRSVPSLAYASQQPFLFEGTIRDNILFGTPIDETLYAKCPTLPALLGALSSTSPFPPSSSFPPLSHSRCWTPVPCAPTFEVPQTLSPIALSSALSLPPSPSFPLKVLDACALRTDLALWPRGDESLVEEGGGNLSGGQRARVSLARAAYAALHCCAGATHCNRVLVLDGGRAAACGAWSDLCALPSSAQHSGNLPPGRDVSDVAGSDSLLDDQCFHSLPPRPLFVSSHAIPKILCVFAGLLDVEGWQRGAIPLSVFWGYARQMGVLPLLLIAALFLAAHVSNCLASWFLGVWTDTPHTIHHPLLTLTAIALSCVALSLLASLLFHRAALRASSCLHSRMLASVLASPLAFFHRNPTGRVLNRFSEDLGVTDDVLPEMLLGFVNSVGLCIAAVVSACIAVPWTLIPVLPLLLLLLHLRHLYVCTAREVRRMECTTRSVLLARFLATMEGLPTIRAFSQQRRFHRLFLRHVTANATPHLFWLATWEWLGFRLDLLVAAALLSAALAAVALLHSLPPAMAALALSYLLQLPDSLRWALQYGAELENTFTSVERTLEYTMIPSEVPPPSPNSQSKRQQQQQPRQHQQEKKQQQQQQQQQKQQKQQKQQQQQEKSTAKSTLFSVLYGALRTSFSLLLSKSLCAHIPLLPNCQATNAASHSEEKGNSRSSLRPPWPSAGAVQVEQLTVRYGSTGQAVLRSLSFRLAGGEKCGVVGRTGAGKSTLMLALLRLVEASSGSICIAAPRHPAKQVVTKVVAIPQEPVLFSQSLRFNLDPLGQHRDEALWSVLATVRLKPLVAGLLGGLDGALAQGGGNLSLGQRQLLCLAR
ncbi:unnamed protein product [Closterium sp. Naga37s-1]|nr:unnamed protein product [Closterium sp. Naga37s-1]